ncbi:hypothetical protein A4D02_09345 [Niastella koreensis]|nr:hypothetical protein A4D02_09345 [Niastella koreensis]
MIPLSFFALVSCEKFIEVDPPSTVNADNVYSSDATAASVLTGIYTNLSKSNITEFSSGGVTSVSLFAGLSADEIKLFNPNYATYAFYYKNDLSSISAVGTANYWGTIYPIVYVANSAIEGITSSNTLTPSVKNQLLGEARFIRAFCYFYLANLYGDVPLILTSNWQTNSKLAREGTTDIYQQIVEDLTAAKGLLSQNYLKSDGFSSTTDRVRPCKWVASALLARVYLYLGDWQNAEMESSLLINNSSYKLSALNDVFLKNSNEAIWQLQAVGTGVNSNTGEGKLFVLPPTGPNNGSFPVYLSDYIVNSFENGDQRKLNWVGSVTPTSGTTTYYFPNKYKIGSVNTTPQEYCTVFRLAEQYLIRAEARAQLNKPDDAQSDLNVIRSRAGLGATPANQKQPLLDAIMKERKVEFFTEWGNRWFDLKRTNTVDALMSSVTPTKGGTWQTTDQLYPIPKTELDKSPQLIQNSGY